MNPRLDGDDSDSVDDGGGGDGRTVVDVACSQHAGRWYATVAEAPPPSDGRLLTVAVDDIDDVVFAVTDLLAARRSLHPRRLRLLGPELPALFTAGRSDRRLRGDGSGQWSESWTSVLVDDTVVVTVHRHHAL